MAGSSHPATPGTGPPEPGQAPLPDTYVQVGTNTGVFAVGSHAQATQVSAGAGTEEVLARLDLALRQLTVAATAQLDSPQAEQVGDDAERVAEETRRKRPDRDRISQLIGRITARVGSVAVLLEAVERVKNLIEALPH
jgi:hypothetical protein